MPSFKIMHTALLRLVSNEVPVEQRIRRRRVLLGGGFLFSTLLALSFSQVFANPAEVVAARFSNDKQEVSVQRADGSTTVVLRIGDVRGSASLVSPHFELEANKFHALELSPDRTRIAFSVVGSTQDWAGIVTITDSRFRDVDVLRDGTVKTLKWSLKGSYLLIETVPASGIRTIRVFDTKKNQLLGSLPVLMEMDKEIETFSGEWLADDTLSFKKMSSDEGPETKSTFVFKR